VSVLYLCEKPSQAADLAKVLGDPRRRESHFETARGLVTYAIGHLLELDEPGNNDPRMKGAWRLESLPFEPLAFRYVPKQSTRGQLSAIGKLLKSATTVVIATDALWGEHFWSPSYFAASSGGAPLELIQQYVQNQRERPSTPA
jgi:DNA topoisomerase III